MSVLVASAIVAVACSGDDDAGSDASADVAEPPVPTSPVATSPATTSPATTPPVTTSLVTTTPATTSPPAPSSGSVTEVEIVSSVDWVEVDEHGVWFRAEPGLVILVDPQTNQIADQISVGGTPCQSLGVGAGSVWSCAGTDIVRLDAETHEVVATYPVNKAYNSGEVPVTAGTAWVLTGDGSGLVAIDPATDTVAEPIALPVRGTEIAAGPSGIWIAAGLDSVVLHVDPATGSIGGPYAVPPGPIDLAVDGDEVWVTTSAETVRLDPATGAVAETVPVGAWSNGAVALSDDVVWVRNERDFVVRIDRATGEVIHDEHDAEYAEIAGRLTSGGDIAVGFGSVWTSAYDDGVLYRLAI